MIKQFSKSIHLKLSKEELEENKNLSDVETLCFLFDINPIGESYCISNYEMAFDIEYNGGFNYYRVTFRDLAKLKQGKLVILYELPQKYIEEVIWEEMEV